MDGRSMPLRPLVLAGGTLAMVILLPLAIAATVMGHADVARGLLLGCAIGLLNSFLLARKLDRVRDGHDPWEALTKIMRRNMIVRFSLIFAIGAAASYVPGIHLVGMVGGVGAYLVISLIYFTWAVARYYKKEGESLSYG